MRITAASSARAVSGETVSGDVCEELPWSRGTLLALADGLGHGPQAMAAADRFMTSVRGGPELSLEDMFAHAHRAVLHTRGVVAAVARFDEQRGEVEVAGLGNVAVLVARAGDARVERPVLVPGVVGTSYRAVRPQRLPFGAGDVLVMHSDGVRPRFDPATLRGMSSQGAVESVIRMHGRGSDDASCIVAQAVLEKPEQAADPLVVPSERARDIPVQERSDAECAALEARTFAQGVGLGARAQWEVSIATSELATNMVKYARGGMIRLRLEESDQRKLVVEAVDQGFGIADVEAAFADGFSQGKQLLPDRPRTDGQGLGVGLGSVRRMMDTVEVESAACGTRIVACKFIR